MGAEGADETALQRDHFSMPASPTRSPASLAGISGRSSRGGGSDSAGQAGRDPDSRQWVEQLRLGHPRYQQTVTTLHDVLHRIALYELSRRRGQLRSIRGPELDDLAQQAADDALVSVLGRLDEFRGLSRFTTWACKFVMFEVSAKVARHAWRRDRPHAEEIAWDQLPDPRAIRPEDWLEQRAQLDALSRAIGELTDRQREVFVAVALNDAPIDVLAVKLGPNRNAVYKNLFDGVLQPRDHGPFGRGRARDRHDRDWRTDQLTARPVRILLEVA
jgi:RNA polymerase sigma-70 factor (ECF subfamily)